MCVIPKQCRVGFNIRGQLEPQERKFMQLPEPQKEHQWLQRLVGDWTYEHECHMGPDQPPMKSSGRQSIKPLGGFWILMDMIGSTPDGHDAQSIIQLGYDPKKQQFVGTFIASMMDNMWLYAGTLDESGKILTLDSEGPSFVEEGATGRYQDIIEMVDDNQFVFRSQFWGPDGQWVPFMRGMNQRVTEPTSDAMQTLTPHIVCADAIAAIDFYQRAFNATEVMKLVGPTGKLVHAAVKIGQSMLMLAEELPDFGSLGPKSLKGSPVVLHLVVPDVDAAIAQAVAAGAIVTMPAADMFWGDRYGQIVDPYGHRWSIATRQRKLTPAEVQVAFQQTYAQPPAQ